jgi:hypothetical protein
MAPAFALSSRTYNSANVNNSAELYDYNTVTTTTGGTTGGTTLNRDIYDGATNIRYYTNFIVNNHDEIVVPKKHLVDEIIDSFHLSKSDLELKKLKEKVKQFCLFK